MIETAGLDLADVVRTGLAAPSRWAAKTLDGRPVDIRLRHGELTVRIGPKNGSIEDAKLADVVIEAELPDMVSWASWDEVANIASLRIRDASAPD